MKRIYKDSLAYHKKYKGKLAISSKVPMRTRRDLSLAYTPGVAQASIEIGKNSERAYDYTLKQNSVAVVSDGSAILGLGNLGAAAALPVMEGKAILFKEFANVDAFPICLDTQDTEEIIQTVKHIAPAFGGINLEDIAAPRCFEIERRLSAELKIPVMHDDQHGTAVVVLAAFINALKVKKLSPSRARVVINGAGAAGTAITRILLRYGVRHIIVLDSKGALYRGRRDLEGEKKDLAQLTNREGMKGNLAHSLIGMDVFIGVSKGDLLTGALVRSMAPKPVIFALANPTPEILPLQAKAAGAFITATGRSDFPNQINNLLAFPGIFRGALDRRIGCFTEAMYLRTAKNLAGCITHPTPTKIIPDIFDKRVLRAVSDAIR